MLALIFLLGSSLLSGDDASASMNCESIASVHTREVPSPVFGRDSMIAFLRIYSEDDHSKNSHKCQAEFELIVLPSGNKSAIVVPLLMSIGEWDRRLSVHLDGFSQDGKRILGTFYEGGKDPFQTLFDFDTVTGKFSLRDLKKARTNLKDAKCGSSFAAAGITPKGAVVIEPRTSDPCREKNRWIIDPANPTLQPLQGQSFSRLYNGGTKP
jgi:hypothetical protein